MSQDDFFAQIGVEPPGPVDSPPPTRRDRKRRTKERKRCQRRRQVVTMLVQELLVSWVGKNIKLDMRVLLLEHLNKMGPFSLSSKRTGEAEALEIGRAHV